MLKILTIVLFVIFSFLEYRFWCSDDSILKVAKLNNSLASQNAELVVLKGRNQEIAAKINNIKTHASAIEEQARYELGMIRQGEKYYQVVDPLQ